MKYIKQQIAGFTSSTLPHIYNEWSATTTYNTEVDPLTDVSVVRYGSYLYRTVTDGNLGHSPVEPSSPYWIKWGVSNTQAMIDLQSNTRSTTAVAPDFTTSGVTQVVNIVKDNIVLYTAGVGGIVDRRYLAKTTRASIDINIDDFANTANWELLSEDIVVVFPKGYIDTIAIGYYTATSLTIEILDDLDNVLYMYTETQSPNEFVEDYFTYIYEPYSVGIDRSRYFALPHLGTQIRLTLTKEISTNSASCGFLVGGEAVDMGLTLYGVNFSFQSYSVKSTDAFGTISVVKRGIQDLVDFETTIDSTLIKNYLRNVKSIYDETVAFVLDPSDVSSYENLVTLGIIDTATTVLNNGVVSTIAWSIQETL